MDPIQIQYLMRAGGRSMADVARSLHNKRTNRHLTPAAVRAVIYGQARSRRVECRIAAATGIPLHELWPQWYGADGKPITRKRHLTVAEKNRRAQAVMEAARQFNQGAA